MKALKILGTMLAVMVLLGLYGEFLNTHPNARIGTPVPAQAAVAKPASPPADADQVVYCKHFGAFGTEVALRRKQGMPASAWHDKINEGNNTEQLKAVYHRSVDLIYQIGDYSSPDETAALMEQGCMGD